MNTQTMTGRQRNAAATRSNGMNTSTFENRASFARAFVLLVAGLAMAGAGCSGGGEGERCIPQVLPNGSAGFSHNDCNNGLVCTTIVDPASGATCGESYCCKADGTSMHPNCNPSLIAPAPDGAAGICPVPTSSMTMPPPPDGAAGNDGSSDSAASPDASGD